MQLNYQIPQQFSDFKPDYIANLAQQNNYPYIPSSLGDAAESSLYNNPKTNTAELYKLQFEIAGLKCEYYTADFTPMIYQNTPQGGIQGTNINPGDASTVRMQVQVFSIDLPYDIENLYVESRTNITFNNILGLKSVAFKDSDNVQLEGDFSYFFRAYVPKNEEINAFTILAPNLMLQLLADGGDYDFEFSGSKIYFYRTFGVVQSGIIPLKQSAYNHMLAFGIKSAQSLARASRPAKLTDTTNVPEMWQLYGLSNVKLAFTIGLIIASFFFLFACLTFPPFWPLGIVIIILFYTKYRRLLKKRERLVVEWHAKQG
ncbi:MAG: hypothetical protein JWO55_749 [Candidatus Saccharibacteria bacterium]|nr:hypothetical protein [Candidatus Saccharibacteria bacterium]